MALLVKAIQMKLAASGLDWIKLESLHFSSRGKELTAEVSLDGEERPLTLTVRYSISADNVFSVKEIETGKKWLTEAARLALLKTGNRFPLPSGLKGKLLRVFL